MMAMRKVDPMEAKVLAFAEQLGSMVGTIQARAEGWLDRKVLSEEVGRILDGAADLLEHVKREGALQGNEAAKQAPPPATRGRGPVDAPGKRHRKPLPAERLDKRMGEPVGKKLGQKGAKSVMRRGRG
jgi:hypothetical protein